MNGDNEPVNGSEYPPAFITQFDHDSQTVGKEQRKKPSLSKKLAWCLLVLLVLLVGVWLCWLAYHAWPIAMDSVGELPDLP